MTEARIPSSPRILSSHIQLRRFAGPESFVDQLAGIRVAHLTDLHVGRVTPMRVQYDAATLTNAQSPDLVVITGDFVCHSQKYLDELADVIARFEAPVLCVLGNHDYWSGGAEVREALRRGGAEVLSNQSTVLSIRHQSLQIVGLDDAYTGHADRQRALRGMTVGLPTIALSHIAEEADALWASGIPLVFSGHTHAGQITFAKLHELSIGKIAGHKYVHGLYGSRRPLSEGPTGAVYVGAGIGAAVMPLRLGERGKREVAIFELGESPGTFAEHHDEQDPLPGRKPSQRVLWKRAARVFEAEQRRAGRR